MKTFVVFIIMALFAVPALAETYTWEDEQGTVNFAEDLGKVPKKFRKKARILGQEDPPPPEEKEGDEKPAVRQQAERAPVEAGQGSGESAPTAKKDKKRVYGGKNEDAWKSELASVSGELKDAEKRLVEQRNRLKDTSGMSRQEYLSIQNTIRSIEYSVLGLRQKLDGLKKEAAAAGVPAGVME